MPTKRPAADIQPLESKGKIKKGPSKSTEVRAKPPPVPIPAIISGVDSVSPSPRREKDGDSHELLTSSGCRSEESEADQDSEAGCDRVEAEAHLGSPSFHQSGLSSDDLFGEDEVESVRPVHVEALDAAYMSLESEGGAAGAAAFGTKRGRMPSAKIAIARLYGWSSSDGFAEATCLEAEPGRGQMRITEDLVGGPHGGIVHFCATDAKVCKAGWPGRRVYHFDIGGRSPSPELGGTAQKGVKNARSSLSLRQLRRQTSLMKTSTHLARDRSPLPRKPTELQQKLEDIKQTWWPGSAPARPGSSRTVA